MENDVKHELDEIRELTEENNRMLHSMRRSARIGFLFRLLYWTVILGAAVGAFYFVQPYFDSVTKVYKSLEQTQQKVSNFPTSWSDVKNYFGGSTTTPPNK